MASNQYVNFYTRTNEQTLVENLIVEAIKFYAEDVIYLPRNHVNPDDILNELEYASFTSHANVEVYVKNFSSFQGDGNFFGKFGLEVRDQMTLTMSIRSFNEFVAPVTNKTRPMEGDLIFIPMTNSAYQISYVETAAVFYATGKLQTYDLKCDLFEMSDEIFNTGLPVDNVYRKYDTTISIDNDAFNQNDAVQVTANSVLDWSDTDFFGEDL
jgi:hypothetical protein